MSGMLKLLYSASFDPAMEVTMRIIEDPAVLTKSASTVFGCDYDALKPDDDHVGIHLTAVGAFERYGSNRNGDSFPKQACVKYHPTFVKHGQLFRHHRNKDRANNLGSIKASSYNEPMERIELFTHAHKERARAELDRLEKDGEIPFSMACKVAFDRCNICGALRKNGDDPNQCDHIKYELGKIYDDGKIACTHNDEPDFFDISFVGRPADRIAWQLKVAAGETLSGVKLAEAEGLWVPDYMAIESASGLAKFAHLKQLAVLQDSYRGWLTKQAQVRTPVAHYFYELRKAANAEIPDAVLEQLRVLSTRDAFQTMAKAGALLTVPQFFKFAMGPQYREVEPLIPAITRAVPRVVDAAVKAGECQVLCNDCTFDVDCERMARNIPPQLVLKLAAAGIVGPSRDTRIIMATLDGKTTKIAVDSSSEILFNRGEIVGLARKYAAYQLAAIDAIIGLHPDTDADSVLAVAAAQNLLD